MKVLFFGTNDPYGLCKSYMGACQQLGIETQLFDFEHSIQKNINYGKFGLFIHQHLAPENWIQKINRHFVVTARSYHPDLIFSVTNAPLTASALLFLKSVLPETRHILIWPDSLLNFKSVTLNALPLYDIVATYGEASVKVLRTMTNAKVQFTPLAGDLNIHGMKPSSTILRDVGFVGGWRPERQRSLDTIVKHFPGISLEIYGPEWKLHCKGSPLEKHIRGNGLRGKDMAYFFNTTRININTIDDTNFPSANMRFFEIPTAGGLELVSNCPEMEPYFLDKIDVCYFKDENSLIEQMHFLMNNPEKVNDIKQSGYSKIVDKHNYTERLNQLLQNAL